MPGILCIHMHRKSGKHILRMHMITFKCGNGLLCIIRKTGCAHTVQSMHLYSINCNTRTKGVFGSVFVVSFCTSPVLRARPLLSRPWSPISSVVHEILSSQTPHATCLASCFPNWEPRARGWAWLIRPPTVTSRTLSGLVGRTFALCILSSTSIFSYPPGAVPSSDFPTI